MTAGPAAAGPVVSGQGPTVVHDSAYSDVETHVWSVNTAKRTIVFLVVSGMPSSAVGKTFGAHVHINACGADPLASGGHYVNPAAGDSGPVEAKEIWLDFKVRAGGYAVAVASARWAVAAGDAKAVVIHALPTAETGAAGARLLCTSVPFGT